MPDRSTARIRRHAKLLVWLLDPVVKAPKEARALLLGQLLSSPFAVLMGSVNSLLVSTVGVLRHEGGVFTVFVGLELAMMSLRLATVVHVRRQRRAGTMPPVDAAVLCSAIWCALQGALAFVIMQTGDAVLMVLAATLVMGIVGPICARNYPAPRLALLLVALCDLPFKAGAALSGNPWLLVLLPMTPPFLLGAMQVVLTFQKTLVSTLRAEMQNRYLANHDALTGLLNRQGLEAALVVLPGDDPTIAVLGADLDGFKQANDRNGHAAGDALLREVAARLTANVRPGDLVARIGGDEFLVVVRNLNPENVAQITGRLIRCVAGEPFVIDGQVISVGMSVGYACYPEDAADMQGLRLLADDALYAVKRGGKGRGRRHGDRTAAGLHA